MVREVRGLWRKCFRKIDAKFECVEQVASESAIKCFSSGKCRGRGESSKEIFARDRYNKVPRNKVKALDAFCRQNVRDGRRDGRDQATPTTSDDGAASDRYVITVVGQFLPYYRTKLFITSERERKEEGLAASPDRGCNSRYTPA